MASGERQEQGAEDRVGKVEGQGRAGQADRGEEGEQKKTREGRGAEGAREEEGKREARRRVPRLK